MVLFFLAYFHNSYADNFLLRPNYLKLKLAFEPLFVRKRLSWTFEKINPENK